MKKAIRGVLTSYAVNATKKQLKSDAEGVMNMLEVLETARQYHEGYSKKKHLVNQFMTMAIENGLVTSKPMAKALVNVCIDYSTPIDKEEKLTAGEVLRNEIQSNLSGITATGTKQDVINALGILFAYADNSLGYNHLLVDFNDMNSVGKERCIGTILHSLGGVDFEVLAGCGVSCVSNDCCQEAKAWSKDIVANTSEQEPVENKVTINVDSTVAIDKLSLIVGGVQLPTLDFEEVNKATADTQYDKDVAAIKNNMK